MNYFSKKITKISHYFLFSIFYFLLLTFHFSLSFAQAPDTVWTKIYGWAGIDVGYSVQMTSDNGYIIAGYTEMFGGSGYDVWLVKTDGNGDTIWTKTYGGGYDDLGMSVQQTFDKGYIVAGYTYSYTAGMSDIYLIKTDSLGDTLWTKSYGGTNYDECRAVRQTSDGGYIIAGWTKSFGGSDEDAWLLKTDSLGDTLWTKVYGGDYIDHAWAVQPLPDTGDLAGGYIVIGQTHSFGAGGADVWLLRTDSLGDTLWTKAHGESGRTEIGEDVQQTNDNGYIVTGYNNGDLYLLKTYANGDTAWTKTYGTEMGGKYDRGWSVQQTSDNGYIIAGYTESFGAGDDDVWILKTNPGGDTLWTKTYGGINEDGAGRDHSIQQTSDSTYIVVGFTASFGPGSYNLWLLKLGPDLGIEEESTKPVTPYHGPTIFSGPLILPEGKNCKIFDITGRTVDANRLAPGIYFIEIEGQVVQKIIKLR